MKPTLLKALRKLALVGVLFLSASQLRAQLTGTKTIPTDYASIASFVTDLNSQGVGAGGVILSVPAGYTETAPAGGFVITTTTGTAANQIAIIGGGTPKPVITASSSLTAGALNDGIFVLVGADYVTIDNLELRENPANTTTTAGTNNMTEWGIALVYASVTDGANNCTISNNTIVLNKTYQNTFGIYANATHTLAAPTTSATATSPAGGNSGLKIYTNDISNVNNGILVVGPTGAANQNDGIDIGGSSAATGNIISNYATTGTFSAYANVSGTIYGILVRNSKNFNISNNSVTSAAGGNTAGTLRGIYVPSFSNAPTGTFANTVNSNTISLNSGNITGAIDGISVEGTSASATSSLTINNNNFTGLGYSAAGSGTLRFIASVSPALSVTSSGNTFTNVVANTSGTLTFLAFGYSMPAAGSQTLNNNNIVGTFNKSGAGGSLILFTSNSTSPAGSTHTATGNNFSNITVTGATSISGWSNTDGGQPTKNISGNTFTNWTGGTGGLTVINQNYGGNGSSVSNNIISNITAQSALTAIVIGGNNQGAAQQANGNQITGLSTTGAGGAVTGIAFGANAVTTMDISGNTITNLTTPTTSSVATGISVSATNTVNVSQNTISGVSAAGVTGTANGIVTTGSAGTINVFRNKIYDISNSAVATASVVNGISLQGGLSVNTYNNVIGNLTAPAANNTNTINAIAVTSTVANSTYRVYYNSIYMNAVSSGTDFGTTGVFHTASATSTTAALDLRNNIIINESTANGTGATVAYRRSGTALNNYATASNRNLFYAGTPSASNLIFTDGTTPQQTFTGYQGVVASRDANSFTGEAFTYGSAGSFFVSLTGSSTDYLRPVVGITSQVESGAQQITTPAITIAYDGVIRAGNGGYTGTGTSPDLGAFEFEGVTPAPVITLNSVTPGTTTQCTTTARVVSVNVTTISGTISGVVLNYNFNGVAQTPINMTNTSGTTWEGTIPTATPTNATVTWTVVATSSVPLNTSYTGTAYADEPLFGLVASATASAGTICAGDPSTLTAAFVPAAAPSYVAPPPVTNPVTDEDIINMTITQGATVILNNTSVGHSLTGSIGVATGTAGSFANYTAFGPYKLTLGGSYNFSMTSYQPGSAYNNAMGIYIDYNRNGVYTDAGELVYASSVMTSGGHTETGAFVVPATASAGLTRMRIINVESSLVTSPTMTVGYGEYEEYMIQLTPPISSVTWSDGMSTVGTGTPLTVSPTTTTTYTATIVSSGCNVTPAPTVSVNVNPLPTAPTATNSVQCGTQIPTASVTSTTGAMTPTFKWYDAPTAGTLLQSSTSTTYTTNISATTTFYVSEINSVSGCESLRTPVTVTVSAADGIAAAIDFATICIGSSVELTASNTNPTPNQNYTYTWSGATGSGAETPVAGTVVTVTPTVPGTYTYNLSGVDGSCNAVATIGVTVNPFVATLTPINATCNGLANGSFSLNTSACGTMPYTYSVNGSAFGAIPTNLAAGSHSVIVQDDNGFQTTSIGLTITQPATIVMTPTVSADVEICQDEPSASFTGTSFMSIPASGTLVIPFDILTQPTEVSATTVPTVTASPNVISTATMAALPAGSVITSATLVYNGITATGSSWRSDVRLGFSGAVTNPYTGGVGAPNSAGLFDYTAPVSAAGVNTSGGTISLHYFDFYSDNAGTEATFPTGTGVATLTINYTTPIPTNITWWDAPTAGSQIGSGSPFESVGTSSLPNTSTAGTYTMYAGAEYGGCVSPSRTPVNVTINAPTASTIVAADCDSYTLNGTTYTATGIYTQNIMNVAGCDSTITLDLTIYGPTASTTTTNACGSFVWTDGNTYSATGLYTQTLTNVAGCDSIATLDLTINDNASTTTISNCGAYVWTDGNTYGTSGTYTQTLTNVAGCDSIATLDLTITVPTSATLVDAACDSYTVNGQTYTSTGMYVQNLTNIAGCDSTLTIDLTITYSNSSNTTVAECDAYVWTDGNTYTSTGVYTQTLTNVSGCDSIATLNLTINTTPTATATDNGDATITASSGASYQWIDCATNTALVGETAQTLNVTVNGSYAVVVSNGSCGDTSACVTINYIGLQENAAGRDVVIYPNPTRDNVTVQFSTATAYVEIYDAQGKLLETMIIENGSQVSLTEFERGVYYLKVRSDKETSTHRIVKN